MLKINFSSSRILSVCNLYMRRIGLISDVASALLQGEVYEPVCKFKAICDYIGSVVPNNFDHELRNSDLLRVA